MDDKILALPKRLKVAGPLALTALAALLFTTAPTTTDRYAAGVVILSLGTCGYATAWSLRLAARTIACDKALVNETLHHMTQIIEDLQADPRTAASGQLALDTLRNVWGDRAEEWLGKSGLN